MPKYAVRGRSIDGAVYLTHSVGSTSYLCRDTLFDDERHAKAVLAARIAGNHRRTLDQIVGQLQIVEVSDLAARTAIVIEDFYMGTLSQDQAKEFLLSAGMDEKDVMDVLSDD